MLAIGPLTGLALFIFRFCTGNHPSVTFGDSSPQGALISHLMFAVVPRHKPDAHGVVPHAGPKNQPNNGHVHPKKFISQ